MSTAREYLDFLAGIAVNSLGHAHPVFVDAVASQAATLAHVSNYFATEPQIELAERLTRLTRRRPGVLRATRAPRRSRRRSSSRGCTRSARASCRSRARSTAARWGRCRSPASRRCSEPFLPAAAGRRADRRHDRGARGGAGRGDVAALVVEPIKGEAGVVDLPAGYLAAARQPHAASTARCSSSTRSRPAPGARASGSRSSTTPGRSSPTRSPSRRASAAASRSARSSPSARRATCSPPGTTARPSAATRSRRRRRTPCSARSSAPASSRTPGCAASSCAPRSRRLGSPLDHRHPGPRAAARHRARRARRAPRRRARPSRCGLIVNAANDTRIRLAPPLIIGDAEIAEFIALFAEHSPQPADPTTRSDLMTRHFLRDDDLTPGRADRRSSTSPSRSRPTAGAARRSPARRRSR